MPALQDPLKKEKIMATRKRREKRRESSIAGAGVCTGTPRYVGARR